MYSNTKRLKANGVLIDRIEPKAVTKNKSTNANFTVIFPEARGRLIFKGCNLSVFKSVRSLTMYPILDAKENIRIPRRTKPNSENCEIPAAKGAASKRKFFIYCFGRSTFKPSNTP